jgi:hypothetical protein
MKYERVARDAGSARIPFHGLATALDPDGSRLVAAPRAEISEQAITAPVTGLLADETFTGFAGSAAGPGSRAETAGPAHGREGHG